MRILILISIVGALLACGSPKHTVQWRVAEFRTGETTLKERIAKAEVIARVSLNSVSKSTEQFDTPLDGMEGAEQDGYVSSVDFVFDVHEYLKGTGSTNLTAIVFEYHPYPTVLEAKAKGRDLQAVRDTQWDDREAIIFLDNEHPNIPSSKEAGRYFFGLSDAYMIDSDESKKWMPAAMVQSGSPSLGDQQRFLLDEPEDEGTEAGVPTITLIDLKTEIADIARELSAGDGSEAYRECVAFKYQWERETQFRLDSGIDLYRRIDDAVFSGLPAGVVVYEDAVAIHLAPSSHSIWLPQLWLEGSDNDLFAVELPGIVTTARPLPAGEYRFYYLSRLYQAIICDAYPEQLKRSREHFVTVTAPSGVLHELFFDPVTVGSAVYADDTNGELKPATFTDADGGSATIEGISYESTSMGSGQSGTVEIEVDPHESLTGQLVDFIELDGTVSLSLDAGDATVDSANDTLSWGVSSDPWEDGDQLMVRIRQAR